MADIWREPIFDRTYTDVTYAIQKIADWKVSHTHMADIKVESDKLVVNSDGVTETKSDSIVLETEGTAYVENDVLYAQLGCVYDLKGCLNLSDLTRIEDNISYIAKRLISYRYPIVVASKEWVKTDLPNENDMKRIANNIKIICNGFVSPSEKVAIPDTMLSYQDINNLERNLYLLKELLDLMIASFIKSGTHKCGSTNRLPIRR